LRPLAAAVAEGEDERLGRPARHIDNDKREQKLALVDELHPVCTTASNTP
jgi:hypothetical protein